MDCGLHFCCNFGWQSVTEALLEKGANPDIKNILGGSPLHDAAWSNQLHCIRLLLSLNANINAARDTGHTALDLAYQMNNREAYNLLRANGGRSFLEIDAYFRKLRAENTLDEQTLTEKMVRSYGMSAKLVERLFIQHEVGTDSSI